MSAPKIELTDKVIPDAFHGTTLAAAANILVNGFRMGVEEKGWLGKGVYFYESSREDAAAWAKRTLPPAQVSVIRATINLGYCLDLHIPEHIQLMRWYYDALTQRIARRGLTDHGNPIKVTEPLVLNLMERNMNLDTIRVGHSTAFVRKPAFPGSRFRKGHQIIICVRNLKNIQNVRLA